jgi:hypothetical protein
MPSGCHYAALPRHDIPDTAEYADIGFSPVVTEDRGFLPSMLLDYREYIRP